jgi:hypothetical protein
VGGEPQLNGSDLQRFGPGASKTLKYLGRDSYSTQIVRITRKLQSRDAAGKIEKIYFNQEMALSAESLQTNFLIRSEEGQSCPAIKIGERYIVFFASIYSSPALPCGVVPASDENLAAVGEGIQEFKSAAETFSQRAVLPVSSVLPVPRALETGRPDPW